MHNLKIFPGKQYPRPMFQGRGKFVLVSKKFTKTLIQQRIIQKVPQGQYPGPSLQGGEVCSCSPKLYQNSPTAITAMQNSKIFPEQNLVPMFQGGGVSFSTMYQNSPTTSMQNSQIFPGTILRTHVLEERKFFFVLGNCTKTPLQQCRIQKLSRGQ